jgi:D-glycero-D-manno-heptose 1,7-bisphosphate phosphatase
MKAIFLDRDGVLNVDRSDYVKSVDEWVFEAGAKEAVAQLTQAGWPVIVISNQACVGKGIISADDLQAITDHYVGEIKTHGGTINQVYYCHHTNEDQCDCRKPQPGMLHKAAQDHNLDLAHCWFIGDSFRDMQAGKAAGCKTILVLSGHGRKAVDECHAHKLMPDYIVPNLIAAVKTVLSA